mgnify:CR=1 FL=1
MAGRLEGKIAVVTGGASGMGKAISERFVQEGARVVLADISGKEGEVADEINKAAGAGPNDLRAVAIHTDVSDENQIKAMIAKAVDTWGRLDILVNNAGFGGGMASRYGAATFAPSAIRTPYGVRSGNSVPTPYGLRLNTATPTAYGLRNGVATPYGVRAAGSTPTAYGVRNGVATPYGVRANNCRQTAYGLNCM